ALALARTRKADTDVERGKRQQEIIKALVQRSLSLKSVLKFDEVIDAVGENMTTNMTFSELKSFVGYLTHGKDLTIETLNIDGYDYQPSGTYYWMFDDYSLAKTINELENHLDMPVTDFGFEYSEEDLADIYDEAPPKDENKTEEEGYVGSSFQFTVQNVKIEQVQNFIDICAQRGVEIKWFGSMDPVGFTSRFESWEYLNITSRLPTTEKILNYMCDFRVPLTFSLID